MTAYERMVARFNGQRPAIQCWSPTEYRVTYHGWHVHNGALTGSPCGDGKSLDAACEALLRYFDRPSSELAEGQCGWRCSAKYNGSAKSQIASRELWDHIERCAAEVDRWPAWKRGLPPCPNDGCERAVGHECECG